MYRGSQRSTQISEMEWNVPIDIVEKDNSHRLSHLCTSHIISSSLHCFSIRLIVRIWEPIVVVDSSKRSSSQNTAQKILVCEWSVCHRLSFTLLPCHMSIMSHMSTVKLVQIRIWFDGESLVTLQRVTGDVGMHRWAQWRTLTRWNFIGWGEIHLEIDRSPNANSNPIGCLVHCLPRNGSLCCLCTSSKVNVHQSGFIEAMMTGWLETHMVGHWWHVIPYLIAKQQIYRLKSYVSRNIIFYRFLASQL